MDKALIDVDFDFTSDTPGFWDNYWDDEMGYSTVDPDIYSKTLKEYHRVLWSKKLPNGKFLNLKNGGRADYLIWENFRFSSDSITTSFRYKRYRYMIKKVIDFLPNYKQFIENYVRKDYTIGGSIIFPKMKGSINQKRGYNHFIRDRFDLTLECIRKYYKNEKSPLYEVLFKNKNFFDLFVDFKGYVDFFYLNDLVDKDYSSIKFWLGDGDLRKINPLPKSVEEYLLWLDNQLIFVKKRNERIKNAINKN